MPKAKADVKAIIKFPKAGWVAMDHINIGHYFLIKMSLKNKGKMKNKFTLQA